MKNNETSYCCPFVCLFAFERVSPKQKDVYPSIVEGELTYKGESYFYRVNAGSWWELTQGERYLMMGYYGDDAIKRGFINGVYDWSEVE